MVKQFSEDLQEPALSISPLILYDVDAQTQIHGYMGKHKQYFLKEESCLVLLFCGSSKLGKEEEASGGRD